MNTRKQNSLSLLLLSICLIACVMTLTGCTGSISESKAERAQRWEQITNRNLGMIADDVDAVFLMNRRSRLSDHVIRD